MCRWIVRIFVVVYAIALVLLAIGTWGLFGQEPDPLSGIFLIPLGLPWNRFIGDLPDAIVPWLAILAPLLNALILAGLCRFLALRSKSAQG